MYGIFINSIKDYIIQTFGIELWNQICASIALEEDYFINSEFYEDAILDKIIAAIVVIQQRETNELFYEIGYWWALKFVPKLFLGSLMKGQEPFKKFLIDFPLFINRLSFIYPNLYLTEFHSNCISTHEIQFLHLPFKLKKPEFTEGILRGFGDLFEARFELTLVRVESENNLYNEYKITLTA